MGIFVDMKYCIVMARIENRLEVRNTLSKQLYEVDVNECQQKCQRKRMVDP